MSAEFITYGMFIGLLIGLFMGHPLAFVLGGLAVIFGYMGWGSASFFMFINRTWGVMDNYILVAIPLFILMAQLLDQSGVAEDLFDTMRYLFGPIRGGIAIAVIVVSTLFGACTGIIGASVVTMGLLGMPVMLKYGYSKQLASGTICAGGTLGILIPPSIMLVVMADQSGLSVGKLFAGAIIPGLILSTMYVLYILFRCWWKPEDGPALTREERDAVTVTQIMGMALKSMVPPLILIAGVLGSIFAGIATPTEAAAVGAVLAFLMTVVYGKFTWRGLTKAVVNTAKTTSMVIIILVGASCFAGVFMGSAGDEVVKEVIMTIGLGKWGTFIVMMIILFILGMFLDWIGIIMICFPLFLPIAADLGFDKVWFVVIIAVMLQDSFLTPPFGYALFYLKGVAPPEVTTKDIYWGTFPFWRLMELGLIACVIWPQSILWLANTLVK
ncbi:MAG: C4-dicarboxylate ABC transporter [Deltaproteobacteria bacterium CG23_combo_of_CG06-09_8_20_14_all_51_20]|nr:TRAP transporter large permease subunit [bacterium]OIP39912.1 MAG: C4-dicarboxylate ABC transporter [Desulfobacteraceae bacterium CG2_30_51_40]PIP47171.1 MAG: C4-dicarboxylate ABC transporter [Deltaproteobacteria bacterium CG23_combo_of_CG06-09_8_20_14_all_51_20]PIY27218.1 MAG: C4-dicarboxylate ABC transporter [Deltaproteobacteria bacterium CG_4_10_14_3_um_filter_51_14]PJB34343.1 MAG: C4-dicarboxylate ABC transporter [Deltaproteobacteria bacterium CG_4_9_14_3_um_filter_51_14]